MYLLCISATRPGEVTCEADVLLLVVATSIAPVTAFARLVKAEVSSDVPLLHFEWL